MSILILNSFPTFGFEVIASAIREAILILTSRSRTFELGMELLLGWRFSQAKPLFFVIKTIRCMQPRAVVLENVQGLERRFVDADGERISCLEFILRLLRRECPMFYFCVIAPAKTCPTMLGYRVRRPREYILGGRADVHKEFADEAAFARVADDRFSMLANVTASKMRSAGVPDLSSAGAPGLRGGLAPAGAPDFCACSWRAPCHRHPCQCGCNNRGTDACAWRARHEEAWAKLPRSRQGYSYFRELWDKFGLDADTIVTSPRERDLLNLRVAQRGGLDACRDATLDISQSYGWDQWRTDGNIPTLATNSSIFWVGGGRHVLLAELFARMGFPDVHFYTDFPDHKLRAFLGNTMHVAVVGLAISVVLSMQDP